MLAASLAALVLAAYFPALQAGFIWDDDQYVTGNLTLRSPAGLRDIWLKPEATPQYYPLVHTLFWLEYRMWGLWPAGFHLVNILIHGANALLLFLLLRRLSVSWAWAAAALFALHPVHVESVAWVTELKNVLSGLFYLSAMLAYFRFDPPQDDGPPRQFGYYALALLLFLCALLSKTVTATLPAALFLVMWWKRPRLKPSSLLPLLPMLAAGGAMGLLTAWLEKHHVQAQGAEWALSFPERIMVAGKALWFYAGKIFWPVKLTFIYPRWEINGSEPWQYLYPAAFAVLVCGLYLLRNRIGKAAFTAVAFFAVSLVPALGFFDVYPFRYSYVADHFQYLASLGLIAGLAGYSGYWIGRHKSRVKGVSAVAAVSVMVTLGTLTFRQSGIYRDIRTIWRDTITKNPGCWMAYNNLGHLYLRENDRELAEQCFLRAVELDPSRTDQRNNLGLIRLYQGRLAEALSDFGKAAAIDPGDARIRYNRGLAYLQMDSLSQAEREFKQTVLLEDRHSFAHCNLGVIYLRRQEYRLAELELLRSLEFNPGMPQAHYNLAMLHRIRGDRARAEQEYLAALKSMPDFPQALGGLGELYLETGRKREAEVIFRRLNLQYPGSTGAE
jgi:Flp pilus assembly protein TadD